MEFSGGLAPALEADLNVNPAAPAERARRAAHAAPRLAAEDGRRETTMRARVGRMEAFDALLESRWRPSGPALDQAAEEPPVRAEKPRRPRKRKPVAVVPTGAGSRLPHKN